VGLRVTRRTYKIGASRGITLPATWCHYYHDRIATVTLIGEDVLILAPKGLEEKAERLMKEVEKM